MVLLMETLMPFTVFRVSLSELSSGGALRRVEEVSQALAVFESSDRKEFVFVLDDGMVVDPERFATYPQIAEREDGSSVMQAASARKPVGDFSTLKAAISGVGQGAFKEVAEDEDLVRGVMAMAVRSSMANVTVASKRGRTLPELSALKQGGREVHPTDKTATIPENATVSVRKKLVALVGQDSEHTQNRHMFCYGCNFRQFADLFDREFAQDELEGGFSRGELRLDAEMWRRVEFERQSGNLFCSKCSNGRLLVPDCPLSWERLHEAAEGAQGWDAGFVH